LQMQQVHYFLALCDELSFTRAGRRCGVSQPTLTNAIIALEQELGGALFQRKPSIALTGLGRMVRPYLDEIARSADHVREVARSLAPRAGADRSARQAVDASERPPN
jgi:LysR family transcriptional regulator, hydrogen peroxide-inducible genes activator